MTNSDGDKCEEDCSHISKAIWLPNSRDRATAAPGDAAKCDPTKKKQCHSSDDWLSLRIDRADQSIMVHRFSFQGPEPYSLLHRPAILQRQEQ